MKEIDIELLFKQHIPFKEVNSNKNHLLLNQIAARLYVRLEINKQLNINWPSDAELGSVALIKPNGDVIQREVVMLSELLIAENDFENNKILSKKIFPVGIEEVGIYSLRFEGMSILNGTGGKFVTIQTSFIVSGAKDSESQISDIDSVFICPSATHLISRGRSYFSIEKSKS